MISKEKFVEYINFLKSLDEKEGKLNESLEGAFGRENVGNLFIYADIHPKFVEMLCDLMEIEHNSDVHYGDDISYFVYELDYGRYKDSNKAIEESDGTVIDLSSAEKLYDYIVAKKAWENEQR